MKVFFHVGPPKSGTSSLQATLWSQSHRNVLGAYYPVNVDLNSIAARIVAGDDSGLDDLDQQLKFFEESSFSNFVFSAENLSDLGCVNPSVYNQFKNFYARLNSSLEKFEVSVIHTIPIDHKRRFYSQVIEGIKHGMSFDKKSIYDYAKALPYFNANMLFDNIFHVLNPKHRYCIIQSNNDSIYNGFRSLGCLGDDQSVQTMNKSPGFYTCHFIHQLNILYSSQGAHSDSDWHRYVFTLQKIIQDLESIFSTSSGIEDFVEIRSHDHFFSSIDVRYEKDLPLINDMLCKFNDSLLSRADLKFIFA